MNVSGDTLNLLEAASRAADCKRRRVGAVVLDAKGRIVGVGWNGLPNGSCLNGDCPRGSLSYEELPACSSYTGNCNAIHAEDSALRAAGVRADGGSILVTTKPCPGCEALIEDFGIAHVEVVDPHTNTNA